MRTFTSRSFWLAAVCWMLLVKLTVWAAPVASEPRAAPSPAEKNRKLLDQSVSAEFAEQPLHAVLTTLGEQTKIKFVLDRMTMAQVGLSEGDLPVTAKLQDVKVRNGLKTILGQYGLSFVVLDDTVLVTTEEVALYRQMRQRVNVDVQEVAFQTALQQLGRSSACNLVLDPRAPKELKSAALNLQLEDVPLENAVRIMAEMAGLKSVRIGNVLFVTTEERAEKIRSEPDSRPQPPGFAPDVPLGGVPGLPGPNFPPGVPPVKIIREVAPAQPPMPEKEEKKAE